MLDWLLKRHLLTSVYLLTRESWLLNIGETDYISIYINRPKPIDYHL